MSPSTGVVNLSQTDVRSRAGKYLTFALGKEAYGLKITGAATKVSRVFSDFNKKVA